MLELDFIRSTLVSFMYYISLILLLDVLLRRVVSVTESGYSVNTSKSILIRLLKNNFLCSKNGLPINQYARNLILVVLGLSLLILLPFHTGNPLITQTAKSYAPLIYSLMYMGLCVVMLNYINTYTLYALRGGLIVLTSSAMQVLLSSIYLFLKINTDVINQSFIPFFDFILALTFISMLVIVFKYFNFQFKKFDHATHRQSFIDEAMFNIVLLILKIFLTGIFILYFLNGLKLPDFLNFINGKHSLEAILFAAKIMLIIASIELLTKDIPQLNIELIKKIFFNINIPVETIIIIISLMNYG